MAEPFPAGDTPVEVAREAVLHDPSAEANAIIDAIAGGDVSLDTLWRRLMTDVKVWPPANFAAQTEHNRAERATWRLTKAKKDQEE